MADYEPEATHYVPYFCVEKAVFRGKPARSVQAACGVYVDRSEHTNEPTCSQCIAWLQSDAADDAETYAALGLELKDGMAVPKEKR